MDAQKGDPIESRAADAADQHDPTDATDSGRADRRAGDRAGVDERDGSEGTTDVEAADGAEGTAAARVAARLCEGFQAHDERDRERAIEAFAAVDDFQFAHVDAATVRRAAEAYVDALWAKDAVEDGCRVGGTGRPDATGRDADGDSEVGGVDGDGLDRAALAAADWSPVESALAERAALLGIDPEYAALTTEGWRRHKAGGDYWAPHLRAQQLELQAALRDPEYPDKPRHGRSGAGPEATRYLLGVELHDTRQWREARAVMVPYFERVGSAQKRTVAEATAAGN